MRGSDVVFLIVKTSVLAVVDPDRACGGDNEEGTTMPVCEHTVVIEEPIDKIAAAFERVDYKSVVEPSLVRISLITADDGQAADLTYEQIQTTAANPVTENGHVLTDGIILPFTGPGVAGKLTFQLVPQDASTKLVQQITYEFTGAASINVLESATTKHNKQVFEAGLATVKDRIETEVRSTRLV